MHQGAHLWPASPTPGRKGGRQKDFPNEPVGAGSISREVRRRPLAVPTSLMSRH
jgi:hypothetical protein